MTRRAVVPLLLCAAMLVAACGADESSDEPAPNRAADQKAATGSTFQLGDFPSGWKDVGGGGGDDTGCDSTEAAQKLTTGHHTGSRFQKDPTSQTQSSVYVFPDERTATKGYEELASRVTTECLTDALVQGLASEEGAKIGRIRTSSLELDATGDQRQGSRVVAPATAQGVEVEVDIDLVVVRTGRGVLLAFFVDAFKPFDETLRGDLTATAVERLSKALN